MPSLADYRRIHSKFGNTGGSVRKSQSDMIMEYTWDEDLESCVAYLYDYYHDDEPEKVKDMKPQNSRTKIPVEVKYIVNAYNSDNKDQVSYHIQFKPSYECNVPYYGEFFEKKYGAEFPIGLYIDIPDNKGIYRKWLIAENANSFSPQFPTWSILPCDYRFSWIFKNKKYRMWGVSRSQSSYNQGTWMD